MTCRIAILVAVVGVVGCGESKQPRLDAVDPSSARLGVRPVIRILGSGFRPKSRVDVGSGKATEDAEFGGELGGIAFDRVVLESAEELRTTLPAGLGVGAHDLVVRTPEGQRLELPDAFRVLSGDGGPDDGGPDDGGPDGGPDEWPDGPPTWEDLSLCGNGVCSGEVEGCAEAGECPACSEGVIWHGFGCNFRIEGNHVAQRDEDSVGCDALVTGLDLVDVHARGQIQIGTVGDADPKEVGLVFRATDACLTDNRFYYCYIDMTAQELRLVAYDGGDAPEWPASSRPHLDPEVVDGDTITLEVSAVGDRISCSVVERPDTSIRELNAIHSRGTVGLRTSNARAFLRVFEVWDE